MAQRAQALSRSLGGMFSYARAVLGLNDFLERPGDGRVAPVLPARLLLRALLSGIVLRAAAYSRIEQLGKSGLRWEPGAPSGFGDDALRYFTARLKPGGVREAIARAVRRAKHNKVFSKARLIGLAVDGTRAGCFGKPGCELCRPQHKARPEGGQYHALCALSVAGAGITLPVDVEPYGPGDSEYAAGQRLIARAVAALGPRFAQYVVGDGEFATGPFLHAVDAQGLYSLMRLKENLPELLHAARARFLSEAPHQIIQSAGRRVELWDAQDFAPWDTLRWPWVRVMRYRYEKADGEIVDAYWLSNMPTNFAPTATLFACAKSRWEIENQGFNDAKNRYGLEHTPHHHKNSVLIHWLLICLALVLERLYRLCYLHRGAHRPLSAQQLLDHFWLKLRAPAPRADTS